MIAMSYLILDPIITNVINYILPEVFTTSIVFCLFHNSMEEAIVILFRLQNLEGHIMHRQFCELFGNWTHIINRLTFSSFLGTDFILYFSMIAYIHLQTMVGIAL